VSHFKEREQKSCLNCNATVQGRFCHICGQENIEPRETIWHLISHFFQDITHFDGKFFSTLKYLLFRPGHLSREYMMGRRTSYLNPIRMYVFTSAFFFLFFFGTVGTVNVNNGNNLERRKLELEKTKIIANDLKDNLGNNQIDSVHRKAIKKVSDSFEARMVVMKAVIDSLQVKDSLKKVKNAAKQDSLVALLRARGINPKKKIGNIGPYSITGEAFSGFTTVAAYDSVQAHLPDSAKDGWWRRLLMRKGIDVNEKASDKTGDFGKVLVNKFIHSLPQMFFLSLPLYAFFLFVLYNRQKKYYYVNHAIFSIHVFCASFIMSFVAILLVKYLSFNSATMDGIYNILFVLGALFYQYKCMRNFYQQRRAKTIAKFIILNLVAFFSVLALAIIFFIISLWNV
jgi:Protein of unknown function (DUF3667)